MLEKSPVQCLRGDCGASVVKIERHGVSVVWERSGSGGVWEFGALDGGSHFHVFCAAGHEERRWGANLPEALQRVVYPGSFSSAPAAASPPRPRPGSHPADGRNPRGAWKPLDIPMRGTDAALERLKGFEPADLEQLRNAAQKKGRGTKKRPS